MEVNCYHCELENPTAERYRFNVLGQERFFCCPGCLAIAQTICDNGMESFYRFRTEKSRTAEVILPEELLEMEALDLPSVQKSITHSDENSQTIELGIEGITCAACGWLIRKQISERKDVIEIRVNTTNSRATLVVQKNARLSAILVQIRKLGYRAFPFSEEEQEKRLVKEDQRYIRRLVVAGLAMMQIMMLATGVYIGQHSDISAEHAYFLHLISGLFATPVVGYAALPFFKHAWLSLKQLHFGMDLPVSIAIISGYIASVYSLITKGQVYYFDSIVMFTFFLLVGRYLEHRMRLKAVQKQQSFRQLVPLSVIRQNPDQSCETLPVSEVSKGDVLIIHSGSVIPVDGSLLSEESEINESVITGEAFPVSRCRGDTIYSGSTNTGASFLMCADSTLEESRVRQLIQLQYKAENLTSNHVALADRVASWYVIVLLILCVLTGLVWSQIAPNQIFPVLLSLLVVSCPCALSLATPTALAAAIAHLTDKGIMIKNGDTLTNIGTVTHTFFDKTGTLTLGQMRLVDVQCHAGDSANTCIQIAKSLESISSHPIARAFKHTKPGLLPVEDSLERMSGGVEGRIGAARYTMGKRQFVLEQGSQLSDVSENTNIVQTTHVKVFLLKNRKHIATFFLEDEINSSAETAIAELKKMNLKITLLTGDSKKAASIVANTLKISNILPDETPESKLKRIQQHRTQGEKVLMIGDGVNDIGALAEADVSVTMGTASQLSRTQSNAVLVSHDLTNIPETIRVSRKLHRVIRQNVTWAVIYNLTAIPFAVLGLVPAWLAAIGMTTSSIVVVLNALRLRY